MCHLLCWIFLKTNHYISCFINLFYRKCSVLFSMFIQSLAWTFLGKSFLYRTFTPQAVSLGSLWLLSTTIVWFSQQVSAVEQIDGFLLSSLQAQVFWRSLAFLKWSLGLTETRQNKKQLDLKEKQITNHSLCFVFVLDVSLKLTNTYHCLILCSTLTCKSIKS